MTQDAPPTMNPEALFRARAAMTNVELNAMANAINQRIQDIPNAALQLGVLTLCASLAFGRVLAEHKIIGGAAKKVVLQRAMKDFANKVRKFGWSPRDPKSSLIVPEKT